MNNSTFELGKLPSRNATLGLMKNRFSSLFSVIMAVLGFLLWFEYSQQGSQSIALLLVLPLAAILIYLYRLVQAKVGILLLGLGSILGSFTANAQCPNGIYVATQYATVSAGGYSLPTNGSKAPDGAGISVYSTGTTWDGTFTYGNTFTKGAVLNITAKYNDTRVDGIFLAFSTDNITWTANSALVNGFGVANANNYTNVTYTIPASLTGAYKYVRVQGNSASTYLNIDAIQVNESQCAIFTSTAFVDNGLGGGTPNNCIKDGTETGTSIQSSAFLNFLQGGVVMRSIPITNGSAGVGGLANGTYTMILTNSATATTSVMPNDYTTTAATSQTVVITAGALTSPATAPVFCLRVLDNDNDGISDTYDIDDDNDGILDKQEYQCPTLATWTDWTTIAANVSATGTLALSSGNVTVTYTSSQVASIQTPNYQNLGEAFGGTMAATGIEGLQALHGVGLTHTYTFSQPVKNPILVFWSMNGSNTFTFTQPFILLGQQGGVTSTTNTITGVAAECNGTIQLLGTYSSISYTSSALENWAGVTVGIQQCNYTLSSDTDLVINAFDLDSDDDGCSDAFEGGATTDKTANFKFTGTVGANGLDNNLETVADNGDITYTSKYNVFGIDNAKNRCTLKAPGGVITDLEFWYKPEAGVTLNTGKVSSWIDQINGIEVTPAVPTNGPTFYNSGTNLINFNPTLNFTNTTRQDALRASTGLSAIPTGVSTFSVIMPDDASNRWYFQWGVSGSAYYSNYGHCSANNPGVWTNSHGGCVNNPTALGPITTPSFVSSRWNNTVGTNQWQLRKNGQLHSGNTTTTVLNVPANTALEIGDVNNRTAGNEYVGNISEVIGYTSRLNDTDRQKVESYIAIKYGITYMNDANTTARDYLTSAGTSVWNATANSAYNNDILAIGRDDDSGLNQKQSKSVNTSAFVTISNANTVAATNVANTSTFSADKTFDIIGDNGLSTGFTTNYTASSFVPSVPTGFFGMARIWKVQETGTVGTVTISVPAGPERLLVFAAGTTNFASGALQEIAMVSDGNGNVTAQVDFANGQLFTFGKVITAPGCVAANLKAWYKADAGISVADGVAVPTWTNSADNVYSGTQATATSQPKYFNTTAGNLVNFNPSLSFDGGDELINATRLFSNTSPFTQIAVGVDRRTNPAELRAPFGMGYGNGNALALDFQSDGVSPKGWNPYSVVDAEWGNTATNSTYQLYSLGLGATNQNGNIVGLTSNNISGGSNNVVSYVNGFRDNTTISANQNTNFGNGFYIGSSNDAQWLGLVPEVIIYDKQLSDAEMQRVYSYLAVKYGSTLQQDYLAGDGTTKIWDKTANTTYHNNVFGIGRDDCQALHQKQSKSMLLDGFVTIGNATGIATTNAANTNSLTTGTFEMIGDNGLAASYATNYTPSTFTPTVTNGFFGMSRIWKVQETGTVGTVTISVPAGAERLLVFAAGTTNFASGALQEIAMTSDGNGNVTAQVNFTNGQLFTFGATLIAPGCVTAGLDFWFDPAKNVTKTGTIVTGWADADGSGNNPALTQATTTLQPAFSAGDVLSNFNPYINFTSTQRLNTPVTGANYSSNQTTFGVVNKYAAKGSYNNFIRFSSADNSDAGTHNWGLGTSDIATDKVSLHYISAPFTGVAPGNVWNRLNGTKLFALNTPTIMSASLNGTTGATAVGNNGNEVSATGKSGGTFVPYNFLTVGGGSAYGMDNNKTQEIIHYSRELTIQERQRVQTYLAIKYGITLDTQDNSASIVEGDYIAGDGITKIWNKTDNSAYHNNVFGIGRDDCQGLTQKQSTSVADNTVTLGIDNKIAATIAANTGAFDTNASFLMWGDNGLATGTTTSVTASPCNPESIDKYTARIWKSVETGSVESTKVSVDLSSYGYNVNFPVYMQVSSTETFASFDNVLMVKNGTNYETNYDFAGTQYVRFTGNTTAPANICSGDKEYRWNSPAFWSWGTKTRTSVLGDTQFKVTISDPTNGIYAPSVYPVGQYWWEHLFIPRYDAAGTNVITTRIEMNKVAYKTAFEIFDIDAYYGKDVVKVYGKLAGAIVNPVLTLPTHTALTKTGNVVSATTGAWDISIWGRVYVNFNSPIDEIYIEYSKSGGYNFKTYQDVRISNIDVTCKPIIPEVVVPDNIYIAKQVTKTAPKVGEPFKYKFTVKNLSCNAKTINFTDILPAGSNLKWVDSTLVTGMTYTSASSYGGTQALSITGLSVPVGDSYLYINAIGTTAGTYDNQATFTVGANTYQSDEPNIAGGANPTPVTLTTDRPLSNLTITKAVDKTSAGANEVIKYTYTITNPNAAAVLTSFTDNLPSSVDGAFKYVAGSLTGASGATINPSSYGGESSLTLTNLSIPTSGLTLSVSVNTGSFTSGQVGRNVASITPDPSTIYDTKPIGSNTVNTTIAGCSAGSDAPAFAKTTVTNLCPSTTINLTAMVATNLPANTVVTWHNTVNASGTNLVPNPGAAPAGTYFAAFYDATNLCYSGAGSATTQVTGTVVGCPSNITVSNACPATTVDLTSRVVGPYPSGKTLTWHSGTPTNTTNKISNASTAGNGTYYAAYYDAANDCYSPATSNGITVNIITCATCTAGSTAPSIASTSLTNVCPQTTVDLSSITASNLPSGSVLTWYKTATPSNAEELSGTSAIGAGTYYAAFHDLTANCFSPSTPVTVTATACQNDLYVDLTTAISQPSPSLSVASASNITVTVSNSGTGPTLIGHPTNTSVTLPAGVSAPATFTSNGWSCVTTGQTVNCSTTSIIAATNGSSAFEVPITPDASTLGTTPTITAGTAPYIIELTTTNNTATMTPTTAVVAPDLTTTIGQPATPLVAGAASNIPVTVANIGTGPTTGSPITTTIALPSGVTAPASFTNGGWGCTTVGSTVSCTTAGPIANGANSSFNVPITPSVAGTTPVITGGTEPTTGEVVTNNNGATMTPTVAVAGVPDLTTSIGQPTTTLTAGVVSNIPVTVANIGGGATTGSPLTTTMTLPAGVTAPASFSSNGWSCTTVGSAINCTTAGPIASAGSTIFNVPVTPNASTVGTSPVFSAGTAPTTNEIVTSNNTATMTPTSAVVAGVTPDLTMTIGQPATALRIGASSDIPVTITNIGSAATDGGAISVSMTLPANVSPTTATFTNNGWSCTTAGQVITCTKTTTITSSGGTATFNIPVTPAAATAGTAPTFTGGVTPTTGETATANNTATMVPSAAILGRPDLTTSIGQPSPALQQGSVSNLPVTVANIGNAPSTGTSITTTVGLPAGVTAPASFSNNGWNCTTASSVVTCATPTPIAGGANSIFNIPITPGASTVGTTPTFTGGTSPDPAETVTGNNTATPLVSSPAVTGLPDLTTSIGQPSPALSAGVPSNVPVTVTNIGTGPANGPIVTSLTLPTGTSAPASFTDGPWTCATTGQTVACTTAGPIAPNNGSSTVNVPVTPTAAIIGTTPPFNATTTPLAGEPNTTNNNATPMTPNIAVAGCVTATVGGTVGFAGTLPVCNAANSGTLTLTGHTGTVVKWQTSSNNWVSSTDIANTATTYTFMNAANNQQYRAVVQNSTQCAVVNSAAATITTSAGACSATCDYAAPVIVK